MLRLGGGVARMERVGVCDGRALELAGPLLRGVSVRDGERVWKASREMLGVPPRDASL